MTEPDRDPEIEQDDELAQEVEVDLTDAEIVGNARRRHGSLGAVMAAGMLGIDQALGRKPKQEAPIVVSSNSDPHDVDTDGIAFDIDPVTSITAPPLPRSAPVVAPTGRKRKR